MIDEKKIESIKRGKPIRLADTMVIAAVLLASLLLIFFLVFGRDGNYLCVSYDGEDTYYSLAIDQTIDVDGLVQITIKDGCAWVSHSNCPNHDCQLVGGKIKYKGQKIVCLPNKIVLKITTTMANDPGFTTT